MGREECKQALSCRAPCCPFLGCAERYFSCTVFCMGSHDLGWAVGLGSKSQVLSWPHLLTSSRIHAIEILGGMWKATLHVASCE